MFLGKLRNRDEKRKVKDQYLRDSNDAARDSVDPNEEKPSKLYKKSYTQKEWNRFDPNKQQIISNRYEVTLSNHETRNQKIKRHAKKINLKNFDKGMKRFGEAQDQFWSEWDKGFSDAGMKKKGGSNTDKIYGKPSKKSNKKHTKIF